MGANDNRVQFKVRKKRYNESTDAVDGVVVFDDATGKIYVGGVSFGSDVKDITYNSSTGVMTITKSDDSSITLNVTGYESASNKVTSLSAQSTDTQYPSAKCVYDITSVLDETLDTVLNGPQSE